MTGTPAAVIAQIKRLQRVYQLTPDDASMAVLLRHNLDSAFAITRYDSAGFVRAFSCEARRSRHGGRDPRPGQAGLRLGAERDRRLPGRPGVPGPRRPGAGPVRLPAADSCAQLPGDRLSHAGGPVRIARLLQLLGLRLDPEPGRLPRRPAQLPRPAGAGRRATTRRTCCCSAGPTCSTCPLTCANTNTALPYIDVVNETLEYFVANGLSLDGYQGHDTGDTVTSAELIASPQYVNDAAYALLQNAFFPPPLPFNRPLALLRLQLASLGVTLPAAMTALRAGDQLVNRSTPTSYGWSDILIEQLTISRDEYRLFTDPTLQLGDLYGLPTPPPAPSGTAAPDPTGSPSDDEPAGLLPPPRRLLRRPGSDHPDPVHQPQRQPDPAAGAARRVIQHPAGAARQPGHGRGRSRPSSSARCRPGWTRPSTAAPPRPTTRPSSTGSRARRTTR